MILQRQSGLGRGLGALIPPKSPTPPPQAPAAAEQPMPNESRVADAGSAGLVREIPVQDIEPNPHQPRTHFDHAQLEDLISSIQEHGIIQPLVVSPIGTGKYQLIAGERRFRAATVAGLKTVPVIVRDASEQQKLELAIIENVQRQDLNPIEEARAYMRLMQEFNLTQDEVSKKVGKSRPQVANMVRLLQLPEEIQQALVERKISASNARTLLSLPNEMERQALFRSMLEGQFTVRQAEERVSTIMRGAKRIDPNVMAAEDALRTRYGTRVIIKQESNGSGEVRFKYSNEEEMRALIEKLKGE